MSQDIMSSVRQQEASRVNYSVSDYNLASCSKFLTLTFPETQYSAFLLVHFSGTLPPHTGEIPRLEQAPTPRPRVETP
ncbi:hypothetical protein ACSQ6I_03740 [Anabaena sp. WFMT]|uniref:hypothetical protein n=1 Tax=Anabaena sp. WFMT TaxID=3449730 RepID=UPI003F26470B